MENKELNELKGEELDQVSGGGSVPHIKFGKAYLKGDTPLSQVNAQEGNLFPVSDYEN